MLPLRNTATKKNQVLKMSGLGGLILKNKIKILLLIQKDGVLVLWGRSTYY